jgi:hypothetical protein
LGSPWLCEISKSPISLCATRASIYPIADTIYKNIVAGTLRVPLVIYGTIPEPITLEQKC